MPNIIIPTPEVF